MGEAEGWTRGEGRCLLSHSGLGLGLVLVLVLVLGLGLDLEGALNFLVVILNGHLPTQWFSSGSL